MVKMGIPEKQARTAVATSLAKAYCIRPYLLSWRNRVNPNWALLGGDGDEEDIVRDEPTPTAAPKGPTESGSAETIAQLRADIEQMLQKQVNDRFANLALSDKTRKEIEVVARATTVATLEIALPPREIAIRNVETNDVKNIGLQHESFAKLLRAVQCRNHKGHRLNIWLTGPTGSGKTSAAQAVAEALGLEFGSDGSLDADYKVLGFRDANGNIISTEFIRIYQGGGIYIADEIDNWMPGALLSLNAALANGWMTTPGGRINRHPDCCVIACANTWGLGATNDYVGRSRLDAASLNRFLPKIDWPYDEKLEGAIAEKFGGELGKEWHQMILKARAAQRRQGLKIIISPRDTLEGIALLQGGFELDEVMEMTFLAGLSQEQKQSLNLTATGTFGASRQNDLETLLRQGKKIEAIRVYRETNGCSLYDAKTAIEEIEARIS
jgi:hypothetical protein